MAALGAAAAVALVGVDGLRERIEVTALPLRASAEQVWSSAARAFPSAAPTTPAQVRAALAKVIPAPDELAEEHAALDRSEDEPSEPQTTEAEPAALAALPLEISVTDQEGAAADDGDAPESAEETFEARPTPRVPAAPRTPAVASAAREEPKARDAAPA